MRKQRNKQRILDAAALIFSEKEAHNVLIKDISEKLGMDRVIIHALFVGSPTLGRIFEAVISEFMDGLNADLARILTSARIVDTTKRLCIVIAVIKNHFLCEERFCYARTALKHNRLITDQGLQKTVQDLFEEMRENKSLAEETGGDDHRIFLGVMSGLLLTLIETPGWENRVEVLALKSLRHLFVIETQKEIDGVIEYLTEG